MPVRRKIKNSVGHYSQPELLVREATSNDPSLPSHDLLIQIAEMTKFPSMYKDTVGMIWKRLNDKCKNWRHIYKALIVIEACLRYGSSGFVKECRYQLPQIMTLCDFVYSYDANSNAGFLIREKAQRVVCLLRDENILRHERQSAKPIRQRSSMSRPRQLSEGSFKSDDLERRQRSQSVYNPADEFVARNDAEEREYIKLAMTLSLQDSNNKRNSKNETSSSSATATAANNDGPKPTLLESSRRAAGNQNLTDDLLIFSDTPASRANRFTAWLENRSKRFSSMSTSDLGTPSSSLNDSGLNGSEKWSVASHPSQHLAALTGVKSDVLADLSGLDFGTRAVSTPHSEKGDLDGYRMFPISANTSNAMASTTLPLHKTSADDFFATLNRNHTTSEYINDITPVPAPAALAMSAPSATVGDKPTSKLSTMLESHRDLVDLENICKISKPPPASNPLGVFGETRVSQATDNYRSLGLNGFDTSDYLTTQPLQTFTTQPLLPSLTVPNSTSNYRQPNKYDQASHLMPDQTRFQDVLKPNPVASPASTNPFI